MKLPARARNVIQANAERLIATGNGLTIVLMVGLVIFALSRLNTIYETVDAIVKNEHVGIESLYTMQSAARERSLLLYAIVHETDPFRREERIQDFTDLANDFGDARRRFLRLNLSERERELLERQRENTNVTLPLQLRVVELVRDGRVKDAERLLNAEAVPAQNATMATLRALLDHELKESVELGAVAQRKRRAAVAWLLSGGGFAVALGLLTGLYVRGRLSKLLALLARSKEELEVRIVKRTHALAEANASLQAEIAQRRRLEEELRRLAATDPLTGIYNRRRFDELLSAEVHRAARYRTPLSFIILDIDRFKRINDTLGHASGDLILTRITALVAASIRADDIFARLGGEEFGVLAPNVTLAECGKLAEKLRAAVEQMAVGEVPRVTCSFGATEYRMGEAPDEFVKRADEALYRAKANGRNRVEAA